MANDMVSKELTYPCEAAPWEKLDDMLQTTYGTINKDSDDLSRFVYETASKNIRWEKLRHLRIIGDDDSERLENFEATGISRGFHLNADGSWMLLILPEKPHLGEYIERCGEYLETLAFMNTQMYSRDWEQLSSLKELYLEDNRLIDSLEQLDRLTTLEQLSVHNCTRLTQITGLGKLTNLKELRIYWCESLSALPGLEKLTQLTTLEIYYCDRITALPELKYLTELTSLNLSRCENLAQLPLLDRLTRLTSLNLSGCRRLRQLPYLNNLTRLTSLDLSYCSRLTLLPPLDRLTQLTSLNLRYCSRLDELPSLDQLTQLTSLDLSWCDHTQQLPLDRLTQLTTLDLSGCPITQLPPLDSLTRLTSLDLSWCHNITQLPPLDALTQLTSLSLFACRGLRTLPDELRSMKKLRRLDLRMMWLQDLPDWLPEIAEGFSLDSLDVPLGKERAIVTLYDTTVESIPDMSIFERPYELVAKWFEERSHGLTRPLNEIKVVFLGDGEAGKSHTIARLMNDGGEPVDYVDTSTPGIVIKRRTYTVDDRQFQVNYWDFGGQEIMHSMHRIFLTGRTMYVVLLNARDDTQSDRAHYWLHNIQSFAPGAPVLLVLNKIDQNPKASVDERTLRSRYPGLTEVVKLSALKFSKEEFNRTFTDALLHQIKETGFLDAQWPEKWVRVKEELENMTEPYILGNAYKAICRRCQVHDLQTELLHWFNDLGVSFCFCDKEDYALRKHVILRPDWITNGLYIILFNECAGSKNGHIPHEAIYDLLDRASDDPTIKCTWPEARYDRPGDVEYVLGVMRKFQLSLDSRDGSEFIPMLCQQDSTIDMHYYEQDSELLEFSMEFDYLPDNLLHRLMVERYTELDKASAWRKGARFRFRELGYSAVVVIDGSTLRFFIRHSKPMHRPNTYLTMLKTNVDRIVAKMGLQPPANRLIYKLDGKRDEFDLDNLKLRMEIGQTHELAASHKKMILIADILNQSAPDHLEDEKKLLDAIKRSCQNIQGDPIYYLKDNGKGMEDTRNRRIRDDLFGWGYNIQDQSQRGLSGSGKSIGELDLLLFNENRELWTIIEALRISDAGKTDWNKHLKKLLGSYNYFGAPFAYLLTYVDADVAGFEQIWTKFKTHIEGGYAPDDFTCADNSFIDLNDAASPQYIRTAKCRYRCGSNSVTVYHIFARIPTQNE